MELYSESESGEIGLCNLAAIVAGRVKEKEYYDVAYYTLLMIDNVISMMDYPFPNLKFTAQNRRSVGVGVTNLAHDMAKRNLKYSSVEGKNYIHRLAELHSYSLHKASLALAKEKGLAGWINRTKYPEGWFPFDDASIHVDSAHTQEKLQDWETLRQEIIEFGGIRHSVLEAFMPAESSSIASNTVNGLYPLRKLKVAKVSAKGKKNVIVAPDIDKIGDQYEIAWDIETKDLIDIYAIWQKFTGQGISADIYIKYDEAGGERKISSKKLLQDYLYMYKMGMKTRYYVNSSAGVDVMAEMTEVEQDDCESCKL